MTVLITLTTAGTSTGPFLLFSDLDGFTSAFETGVPKASLLAGYSTSLVPDGTTTIRVMSEGACTNYIDIPVGVDCKCLWFVYPKEDGAPDANITYLDCDGLLVEDTIKEGTANDFCGSEPTSDQPNVILIQNSVECNERACDVCNCHTVYNTGLSVSSFSYLRCSEAGVRYTDDVVINSAETITVCAIPGSIIGTNIIVDDLGTTCDTITDCIL